VVVGGSCGWRRWPAVLDGGGAALKVFVFNFFYCFPMYFNLLYSFLNSKFQKKQPTALDLKFKETEIYFCFDSGPALVCGVCHGCVVL